MTDDLQSYFLKKIQQLKKAAHDDILTVMDHIEKLENWLIGNRSLQQHRLCQKYITYLWQSYGTEYKSRDGFLMRLKVVLGYADIKEKRFKDRSGRECRDRMIAVKSLSFNSCTQQQHQEFFNNLKEYALKEWGIDFESWAEYAEENPELI